MFRTRDTEKRIRPPAGRNAGLVSPRGTPTEWVPHDQCRRQVPNHFVCSFSLTVHFGSFQFRKQQLHPNIYPGDSIFFLFLVTGPGTRCTSFDYSMFVNHAIFRGHYFDRACLFVVNKSFTCTKIEMIVYQHFSSHMYHEPSSTR